jgi:hypothetical protein
VPHDVSIDFRAFGVLKRVLRRSRALFASQIDRERVRRERVKCATHRVSIDVMCARAMLARVARIELRVFLSN